MMLAIWQMIINQDKANKKAQDEKKRESLVATISMELENNN